MLIAIILVRANIRKKLLTLFLHALAQPIVYATAVYQISLQ